ncbi:TPA: hypothetical protein HA219_03385 [Candidatus Woesearchaeota archaeon]|nr:hypothetical protein [Candidatus Woesearchaeota archaeon]HIH39736.1 hypothetical protein [Candidatus Woesearchaeota archaeon]
MKGHISLFNFFLLLVMFGVIFVILFSITSGSLMTGNAVHESDKNIFPEDVVYKDPQELKREKIISALDDAIERKLAIVNEFQGNAGELDDLNHLILALKARRDYINRTRSKK